jgi:hypothetical protein
MKFDQVVQQWKWGEADTKPDELISRDMTNVFCLPLPQKERFNFILTSYFLFCAPIYSVLGVSAPLSPPLLQSSVTKPVSPLPPTLLRKGLIY